MIKGTGDKVAIATKTEQITYNELEGKILSYSEIFKDVSNNRVAIFSENRLEWIYAFYAIWNNNNVPVPIDFMSGVDDIAFILNDCKPEVIFCSREKQEILKESLKLVKYEPRVLIFEDIEVSDEPYSGKLDISMDKDKTAVIIYTSGTTGSPKGVMLSYDNILVNIHAVSVDVKIYKEKDVTMMLLPMHHIFPLLGSMIAPLSTGGTIAMSPSLNADDIIRTLQANKVSIIIGVPRLYSLIRKGIVDKINQSAVGKKLFKVAKLLNSKKFSKFVFKAVHKKFGGAVQSMVSGGAALDPDVAVDYNALGFDILEGYGMTEAAPMITFTRPGDFKVGSAGRLLPGCTVEIRNGEIVASGRNIMQGYFNREDETNDVLKEGWLYSGDLGYLDKNGYLFITGRKKEIIVLSNGKNINPAEIEVKLEKSSPFIKECGVFMKNDKLNVVIVPNLELMKAEGIENIETYFRKEVISKYNDRASVSKRLLKLTITNEELPRTRLTKLQRFKLVEFTDNVKEVRKVEESKVEEFKEMTTIIGFLEEQTNSEVLPFDRLSDDLGLDSLSRISLIVYIESTFGVVIEEENLSKYETVLQLSEFVRSKKTRITPEVINWTKILKEKVHINLPKAGFSFSVFNFSYKTLFRSFFRLREEGRENIPEGPCIIAPNHQSFLDGFIVASLLKRKVMKVTYIYAKEKHWRRWWQRFLARKNNIILMDINKDLKLSLQKMAAVLDRGKNLIIFPEGTRSEDGKLGEFKKTFAILSKELNVPVIPVSINGAGKAMPVGSKFPRLFKKVSIKFNKPIYPQDHETEIIMEKVQNVLEKQLKAS